MSYIQQNQKQKNRQDRDREFMAMYREALQLMIARGVKSPAREAIRFTVHNGTPRYHVSYDRAYEVVRQMMAGRVPVRESLQRQMWQEIADRVRQLMAAGDIPLTRAVEFVLLNCRASRFFITERYAKVMLVRTRRENRRSLRGLPLQTK